MRKSPSAGEFVLSPYVKVFLLSNLLAALTSLSFRLFSSYGPMSPWILLDFLLEGFFVVCVYAFRRSLWAVLAVQLLLGVAFRAANLLKITFLDSPIIPSDFFLLHESISILPSGNAALYFGLALLPVFTAIGILVSGLRIPRGRHWLATVPAFTLLTWIFVFPASYDATFDLAFRNEIFQVPFLLKARGDAIGIPLSFTINLAKFLKVETTRPSREEVRAAIAHLPQSSTVQRAGGQPNRNVYIILSESFWNPASLLHESADYLDSRFKELWAQNGERYFLSPMFGGGTANVEFEVLCGIPARSLGRGIVFQVAMMNNVTCLPKLLSEYDYRTFAFHPFAAGFYNRTTAFPLMGFQRFFSIEDFMPNAKAGDFIADEPFIFESIRRARKEAGGHPFLAYMMTFAGHWPYDWLHFYDQEYGRKIAVPGKDLKPDLEIVERHFNVNRIASVVLAHTIDAIASADPTALVVIAGDHLPKLANDLTEGGSEDDIADWRLYRTPLLIIDRQNRGAAGLPYSPAYTIGSEILDHLEMPQEARAHFPLFTPPSNRIVRGVQNGATFVSAGDDSKFDLCTPFTNSPLCKETIEWLRTIHIVAIDLVAGSQFATDPALRSPAAVKSEH